MGNIGGMRQVADTSRKRQSTERAGETAGTEKKAGRSRKSPAAKKAEETLNEKKSRGKKKASSGKGTAKGTGSRSRWRKVVQGHLWERKWRLLYHLQYRYFCF